MAVFQGPAQLVDIVDNHDRVIGTIDRARLTNTSESFRVAHVFLFTNDGRLVLGQLGRVRTNQPGRWGSSVAAHLWAGETYEQAAERRLFEELGVRAPVHFENRITVQEQRALKFVGLFEALNGKTTIKEPDHIAGLRLIRWPDLLSELATHPDSYTPTFRDLVNSYGTATPELAMA